jgi:ABC-type branched-subunit amino acid transport system substrate-binding protein
LGFGLTGKRRRWPSRAVAAACASIVLAACAPTVREAPPPVQAPPVAQVQPAAPAVKPTAPRRPVQVALLLPLSGDNATLGQAMLNAAEMALFDVGNAQIEFTPFDTGDRPEGATRAMEQAIADGAKLVLGPLFAPQARAVEPLAAQAGIQTVTFSTDWTLATPNLLVMGFLPFEQVDRIVAYAAAQGFKRIGVLAPADPYGNAVAERAEQAAQKAGVAVSRSARFQPGDNDLSLTVRSFVDYEPRAQALAEVKKQLAGATDADAKARLAELSRQQTLGELPFDAVLLPVGGQRLRTLAPLFPFYDVDPRTVRLLGTGLWDETGTAAEASLRGAVYAAPHTGAGEDFRARFQALTGRPAPRLASLAYDAAALAAALARELSLGGQPFAYTRAVFMNPNGFAGVDGIFRFTGAGLVERGVAVLEVRDPRPIVIDPAPAAFLPPPS